MKMGRRDLLLGALCATAGGAAIAAKPRHHLKLIASGVDLDKVIPRQFGAWHDTDSTGLVVPQTEDSLAAKIYTQTVGRIYTDGDDAVMMLIAYGGTQNDTLQLHRPEACYPAFGFTLTASHAASIPLPNMASVPGRALTATTAARTEQILYWTRIGEFLPNDGKGQRWAKLRSQLEGVIPDGVLVRLSNTVDDPAQALALNQRFARAMIEATPPRFRAGLIGTENARRLG